MITKRKEGIESANPASTATACLTKGLIEQLSATDILLMIREGFELADVQTMISLSKLYSTPEIAKRIVGKASQSMRRQDGLAGPARLNAQQSAVAFQYAKSLEQANLVFGTQERAEEWLSRPCRHLAGLVPVDLFDNAIGFMVVRDYLERVELGVYQ